LSTQPFCAFLSFRNATLNDITADVFLANDSQHEGRKWREGAPTPFGFGAKASLV
jgi:hypothetical protein